MQKAIGMVEYKTVASGVTAADLMVKTADVDIIEAQVVCPGKYIALITGELSAVKSSIEAAKKNNSQDMIGEFVLGNPDEALFPAIYGTTDIKQVRALGIVETYDASSAIVAADVAAKTAIVDLIELRIAKGMCGKSYFMITGEVAACQVAVEHSKEAVKENGMFLDCTVIANPDKKLWKTLV